MNILVTGGAGFIGSHACEHFLNKGDSVVVIDNYSGGTVSNLADLAYSENIKIIEGDIRSRKLVEDIFNENRIDTVLNFAAQVSVPESIQNPQFTYDVNINGTNNIMEVAGIHGISVFVHASSAAVYGDDPALPKHEEMLPSPKSPYAISKLTGEYMNTYFSLKYGYKAVNCRFFNVFGPRQNPAAAYAAAVPIFIHRILNRQPVTVYGDGEQTRDFIYVSDLINAIDHLSGLHNELGLTGRPVNIGYGRYITINNLIKEISKASGLDAVVNYADERPGDIKHSYASVDNLLQSGWKPVYNFEKGLEITCEYISTQTGKL